MNIDVARAWKDPLYRQSLSEEELRTLPENPVGEFELTEAELETVSGGDRRGSFDWRCHRRGSFDWRCYRRY